MGKLLSLFNVIVDPFSSCHCSATQTPLIDENLIKFNIWMEFITFSAIIYRNSRAKDEMLLPRIIYFDLNTRSDARINEISN